jgi:hypothetical protein
MKSCPCFSPHLARMSRGITTWPLAESVVVMKVG